MDPSSSTYQELASSSKDEILAQLLSMGFEVSQALESLQTTGVDSLADAVEFILASSPRKSLPEAAEMNKQRSLCSFDCNNQGDSSLPSVQERQPQPSSINKAKEAGDPNQKSQPGDPIGNATLELLKKQRRHVPWLSNNQEKDLKQKSSQTQDPVKTHLRDDDRGGVLSDHRAKTAVVDGRFGDGPSSFVLSGERDGCAQYSKGTLVHSEKDLLNNLEVHAQQALQRNFGYKVLKNFQLEALKAWADHQDCFVVAATGSGKSLCFQLPALITGKVVVVVSPLISLMHDQCLHLAKQGISSCFLGSGQVDKTVENRAMDGMYSIVYVCPETLARLVGSLQKLAQGRGIALFAIDESHCISKWGHDFRPDYRRLSVLREKFKADLLVGLKHDIPIMALTATATLHVQEDILNSLRFNKMCTKIVRTTLFRPNLRFSVHHSKTGRVSSYEKDFKDMIDFYVCKDGGMPMRMDHINQTGNPNSGFLCVKKGKERDSQNQIDLVHEEASTSDNTSNSSDTEEEQEFGQLRAEDLEHEELERFGGDFDASCGEFSGLDSNDKKGPDRFLWEDQGKGVVEGPSIIYMPTRKETERLSKFLCRFGVRSASYHAKMPKGQLRQVHEQFHSGILQVVVATIAFGMGIDKPNVRRIIHYGWPQSLEAYYQEAGRAGRDGLLSDCILFCDMTTLPSLLPGQRDAEHTQYALGMLSNCFRYGLSTSKCRVSILLSYFGEHVEGFHCKICDACTTGLPPSENLVKEAELLLGILAQSQEDRNICNAMEHHASNQKRKRSCYDDKISFRRAVESLNKCDKLPSKNKLWWRGFGRILLDIGYLRECENLNDRKGGKLMVPSLRFPEVTVQGLKFLDSCRTTSSRENDCCSLEERKMLAPLLHICPEGDMLQALKEPTVVGAGSSSQEWGRGWADPEIRRQRLAERRASKPRRKKRQRQPRKFERSKFRKRRG